MLFPGINAAASWIVTQQGYNTLPDCVFLRKPDLLILFCLVEEYWSWELIPLSRSRIVRPEYSNSSN